MVWAFGRWPGSGVENPEGDMQEAGIVCKVILRRESRGTSCKDVWVSSGAGGLGSDDRGWGNLCCPAMPSPQSLLHPTTSQTLGNEGSRQRKSDPAFIGLFPQSLWSQDPESNSWRDL